MNKRLESSLSVAYTSALPCTVAEARAHARISGTSEDLVVEMFIRTAARTIEQRNGIVLLAAPVTQVFDRLPDCGEYYSLTVGPVNSITSISYNTKDDPATFTPFDPANYVLDKSHNRARIYAPDGWDMPSAWQIKVIYSAGYENAAAIPAHIKTALLLQVTDLYDNRGDYVKKLPTAAEYLMQMDTVMPGM